MDSKLQQLLHTDGPWSDAYREGYRDGADNERAKVKIALTKASEWDCAGIRLAANGRTTTKCLQRDDPDPCYSCAAKRLLGLNQEGERR